MDLELEDGFGSLVGHHFAMLNGLSILFGWLVEEMIEV
jgi:hypothetical protein